MNFGKHVKRKALYCCSVSVVGLLIACLIGFAMGVGLVDVRLEEEAHAAASSGTSSETSSTSGALKKNSAPQSQTQAVSSPTQVALDGISAVEGSATITTQGFTLSADSQAAVQSQIATFEADGYTASFVLADITTGRTIAYNADAQIYSASSAKAPYLISLFSTGTVDLNSVAQSADAQSATVHQKVDAVLRNSDNASYDWLYKTYGLDCFNTWAEHAGAASRMGDRGGYLFTSARDMAKLWTAGYGFLFAGQTAGVQNITPESLQWLSGDMTNSLNSCIHAALGDADTVYTKAGWINGEGDLYALNDAGLVMSQSGTYVLAVLTNACGRNDLLTSLIGTLDAVHSGDMRG